MLGNGNKIIAMKSSLVVIFILINSIAFGQYNAEDSMISRFRPGTMWWYTGLKPAIPEKVRKYDRLIFDVTYNDWIGDEDLFKVKPTSLGLNTNFMFDIPIAKENVVSFGVGGCYSFWTLRHDRAIITNYDTKTTLVYSSDSTTAFKKSTLVGHNFSLPIEFRFRSKGWKHFKFHIGGKVGYLASVYNRSKFEADGGDYILKSKDLFDVSRLTYSVHTRIGIRNWAVFAQYNINPIFTNKSSTQVNHVQMGLSISLF